MARKVSLIVIKHPARDACLYMGEVTLSDWLDLLDPHFLFAIASHKVDSLHIW